MLRCVTWFSLQCEVDWATCLNLYAGVVSWKKLGCYELHFIPQYCPAFGETNHSLATLPFPTKLNIANFTMNVTLPCHRALGKAKTLCPWRRAADTFGSDLQLLSDSANNTMSHIQQAKRNHCLLKSQLWKTRISISWWFLILSNLWSQPTLVPCIEYERSIIISRNSYSNKLNSAWSSLS